MCATYWENRRDRHWSNLPFVLGIQFLVTGSKWISCWWSKNWLKWFTVPRYWLMISKMIQRCAVGYLSLIISMAFHWRWIQPTTSIFSPCTKLWHKDTLRRLILLLVGSFARIVSLSVDYFVCQITHFNSIVVKAWRSGGVRISSLHPKKNTERWWWTSLEVCSISPCV